MYAYEVIINIGTLHLSSPILLLLPRSKLYESLTSKLKEMTKERALLSQRVQESEREVNDSIALMSMLASHLWGEQAAHTIMSTLFGSEDVRKRDDTLPT